MTILQAFFIIMSSSYPYSLHLILIYLNVTPITSPLSMWFASRGHTTLVLHPSNSVTFKQTLLIPSYTAIYLLFLNHFTFIIFPS